MISGAVLIEGRQFLCGSLVPDHERLDLPIASLATSWGGGGGGGHGCLRLETVLIIRLLRYWFRNGEMTAN